MEQQLADIREHQKQSWNKFSGGWKKWDDMMMDFLRPMGEEIIRRIQPGDGEQILDLAAGTGEPGLTIASMIKGGKVVITDLSENMLEIVKEKAAKRAIDTIEVRVCDVCALPFPDNSFDAASCRFGFMFFPDMLLAAKEIFRVLKPGGRMATGVWNIPEKNLWVTTIMGTINRNMELPQNPSGAPGMFRCCKPGLMKGLLEQAGFENVDEKEITGYFNPGTTDNYWNVMTEIGSSIMTALAQADEATRNKIKREVFDIIDQKYLPGKVAFECSALVLSGIKQ